MARALVSIVIGLVVVAACSKPAPKAKPRATRAQCLEIRDHVIELILAYYLDHPAETFDGLDRNDPAVIVGLPVNVTRDTFGKFLVDEASAQWRGNARARLIESGGVAGEFDRCVKKALPSHIACWRAARTMAAFQHCPTP